jgi:hypothetical protein
MWWRRQFNVNWVADPDFATGQNNATIPALQMRFPSRSRSRVAFIRPGRMRSSWVHGLRRPAAADAVAQVSSRNGPDAVSTSAANNWLGGCSELRGAA